MRRATAAAPACDAAPRVQEIVVRNVSVFGTSWPAAGQGSFQATNAPTLPVMTRPSATMGEKFSVVTIDGFS